MIAWLRRVPLWARMAAVALSASFGLGRALAVQPPGQFTAAILHTASMTCPAALPCSRSIQLADGARTLDRMVLAKTLEAVDARDRCGRKPSVR